MNDILAYSVSQKFPTLPKFSIVSLKFFWILSLSSTIFLLAFYIFQTSVMVSESYQIQNYQKKLNELSEKNKILGIDYTQINSLADIENKIQDLGFEKIGKIHYTHQILEGPVVTKK